MTTTHHMQQRIYEVQQQYREWLQSMEKLQQFQTEWQKSIELMKKLEHFYLEGEYRTYYDAIENGEKVDLTTQGEYSIMSEDALWNAMVEHSEFAWQQMRQAMQVLDKDADKPG